MLKQYNDNIKLLYSTFDFMSTSLSPIIITSLNQKIQKSTSKYIYYESRK